MNGAKARCWGCGKCVTCHAIIAAMAGENVHLPPRAERKPVEHQPVGVRKRKARNHQAAVERLLAELPVSNFQGRGAVRTLRCFYCSREGGTIDHWIPLAHGGPDQLHNWRPCCPKCNRRKSDKSPDEWVAYCRRYKRYYLKFLEAHDANPDKYWWRQQVLTKTTP